jgi:hypothetical protein
MVQGATYWVCGQHEPPVLVPVGGAEEPARTSQYETSFSSCDLRRLPFPVALTAHRLIASLETSADILKTLFALKDCFEATVKYLGLVLLSDYFRSPARTPARN